MNFKTVVAASGIAVMVSLSPVFAGSERFTINIDEEDPCAGGATACQYMFTAKTGSPKQITMARQVNEPDTQPWYYYDLPFYTKSQVQAGFYYGPDNQVTLMLVYSADQEGKGGAIVSRVSTTYGATWSSTSEDITNNQRRFGLSVAPDSQFVARLNNSMDEVVLFKYSNASTGDYSWVQYSKSVSMNNSVDSKGLAVILDREGSDIVSVSCVADSKVRIRNYSISEGTWQSFKVGNKSWQDDTAWLYDTTSSNYYLAAKKRKSNSHKLGVFTTTDLTDEGAYSSFDEWVGSGSSPISGLYQNYGGSIYILSTVNKQIKATDSSGNRYDVYESNQNSSMKQRVSSFVVPSIS